MEPISPSQWVVMRLALRAQEPFETWDILEASEADPNPTKLKYKTVLYHLERLVEMGYLVHEVTGAGGWHGRHAFRLAIDGSEIAAHYVDRLLDQLGDQPELLELVEERARERRTQVNSESRSDAGGPTS